MENVKGMASKIDEIKDNFIEYLGDEYLFDYRLLNAKDFGVPQNRERFIMIGNRIGIKPGMIFNQIDCFRREHLCFVMLWKGCHAYNLAK